MDVRSGVRELLPRNEVERIMATSTFINTLGNGLFSVTSALFFTRVVGISPLQLGFAFSVAAAVGLAGLSLTSPAYAQAARQAAGGSGAEYEKQLRLNIEALEKQIQKTNLLKAAQLEFDNRRQTDMIAAETKALGMNYREGQVYLRSEEHTLNSSHT